MSITSGIRAIKAENDRRWRQDGLQPFKMFRKAIIALNLNTEEEIAKYYIQLIDNYRAFMINELKDKLEEL